MRRALAAAALVALLAGVAALAISRADDGGRDAVPVDVTSSPVPVPTSGAYLGASASVEDGQSRIEAIEETEALLGRGLDIDHQFYRWDQALVGEVQQADAAAGRIPFVSWKPQTTDDEAVPWASIAAGDEDERIRATARSLRDFGQPMFAAFHHEPYDESLDGWGSAEDFVAAYRHVVTLAREEGATNVAWVLVLTSWDYHQGRADAFYPGDDVVDWIGVDAYNGFARDGGWDDLEEVAGPFHEWARTTGKPLLLAEWGTTEDPDDPERKAAWLDAALATLRAWPEVRAAVYFDNRHTYDWRLDTSAASRAAARRLAADRHFRPDFGH